jgi:hypothetical protein
MCWVKGHEGTTANEEADRLANQARLETASTKRLGPLILSQSKEQQCHSLGWAQCTSIQFTLQQNGETLKGKPRAILNHQAKSAHLSCLLTSSHCHLPEDPFGRRITLQAMKSCEKDESSRATSFQNSTFRAFRYKWIADLLPIGSRFRLWGTSHNMSGECRRCQAGKLEDKAHLLECQPLYDFNDIFKIEFIKVWNGETHAAPFVADLLLHKGLSMTQFDGTLNENLQVLLAGLPPNAPKKITALTLLQSLWRITYFNIWLPRCEQTIQIDRNLGFTKLDKRSHLGMQASSRRRGLSRGFGRTQAQDRLIWVSTSS